jgi:hypothetical protein
MSSFIPEGKRKLGRPMYGWEDNIKLHFKKTECQGVDWIQLAQDRTHWQAVVNTVIRSLVPWIRV